MMCIPCLYSFYHTLPCTDDVPIKAPIKKKNTYIYIYISLEGRLFALFCTNSFAGRNSCRVGSSTVRTCLRYLDDHPLCAVNLLGKP